MAAVSITLAYFLALAGVAFASTADPVLMHKVLTGKDTYEDTKVECKTLGEDFHIPRYSEDDQRIVIDAMKENVPEAWISVRRTRYPMWKWLDDVPVDHNFAQQDWKPHMNCGVLHLRDNVVEVDNCTYRDFGFVCELPAGKDCLGIGVQETNCRKVDGRTFVLTCSSENWYDAQYQCRKNGMELAVVRSGKIQADLSQNWYRQTKECSQVWIGLRREDWSYESPDDKQIVHYHWAPGQPSMVGDCAVVYKTPQKWHLWKSVNCISQQGRICVRRLAPLTTQATNPPVTNVSEFPQKLNPPQEQSGSGNLGLAVGIPILLLAVGVIAAIAFLYMRRRNRKQPYMQVENGTDPSATHPRSGKEDGASMASSFESLNEPYISSEQIVLEAEQEFGNGGGRMVIEDSDVTLDVPQGAVPRNKIYTIKARVFGEINVPSLQLPRGEQDKVISPLVDMTANGKFEEFVTLSVPHKLPPGELQEKITVYYRQNPSEKWKKAYTRNPLEFGPRIHDVYFKVSPKAVIVDAKHFTQFICTCKGDTRSLGLTGVLFAKYRDNGTDPMEQEIQLNVFVMEAVHSTRENLKALECEVAQHGTHQRMNMQIDLSPENLNGIDQLHIRMATQEPGWNYVTGTEKTKSLYDIASCHKPQLWVLAGEFVLQREAPYKEALDGTRITVTFLVERKSGSKTMIETPYTHYIPFNKRQKRRHPKKKTEETNQTDIQQTATPMPKDKERKDENIDVKPEDMPAERKVSDSQDTEKQQVSENVTEKQGPPTDIGHPVEETKQSPVAEVRDPFMITKTEEEKASTTEVIDPQKSQVLEKGDLDPSAEKQDAEIGLEATEEIKPQDNFYSPEEQKEVVVEDPEKERLLAPDPTQGIPPTGAVTIQKVEEELAKENEKSGEGQNVTSTDEVDSTQKETSGKDEGKHKKKGRLGAAFGLKKDKKKDKGKEKPEN